MIICLVRGAGDTKDLGSFFLGVNRGVAHEPSDYSSILRVDQLVCDPGAFQSGDTEFKDYSTNGASIITGYLGWKALRWIV